MGIGNESPAKRFRVAMVAASPFPFPQGSQVLIAQLTEALRRRGHLVHVVTYHVGGDAKSGKGCVQNIVSLLVGSQVSAKPSLYKPLLDLVLARDLSWLARRETLDIVHTHNFEGLLAGLLARHRTEVPVVYHTHNLMAPELHTYFDSYLGRWAGRLVGRWVDRHLPQRADGCIVLSAEAASALRGLGVLAENIWQIPPGIVFDVKGKESATLLRDRYGLGDAPVVLYAGNLDQYQDIGLLLQSFQRVVVACPDVRLVLASHSDSDLYRTQAINLGLEQWVHFVGLTNLEELGGWMEIGDVAVSPRTVCFGFPIKLLNYMAAGKPIVASAGSAQGIRHMENGWVVSNGDVEAFSQAILTLLEDRALADRLGGNAQKTANQVYTWERIVVEIERVYETLVEAKRLA